MKKKLVQDFTKNNFFYNYIFCYNIVNCSQLEPPEYPVFLNSKHSTFRVMHVDTGNILEIMIMCISLKKNSLFFQKI